jgi:hypothetical protein
MRFFKGNARSWAVPVALSAVLVSALFISPAVGGPKFVTGKKVVTTIVKKTQASSLRVTGARTPGGTFDLNSATSLLVSKPVTKGPHVLSSTFSVTKDTNGLAVTCLLRVPGVGEDRLSVFGGGGQSTFPAALQVAGNLKANGQAELRCSDGSAGVDSQVADIEITDLKMPKVALSTTP